MSRCWQEGDLRAFIDGELPAAECEILEEHLAGCPACAALQSELAARAGRIGAMMTDLKGMPAVSEPAKRSAAGPKWAAAAAAMAAAVGLLFILSHQRPTAQRAPTIAETAVPDKPAPPAAAVRTVAASTAPVQAPVRGRAVRRARTMQYYIALDEDPIETGMVMRVALEGGGQADVIVDAAGRPRAIRPLE